MLFCTRGLSRNIPTNLTGYQFGMAERANGYADSQLVSKQQVNALQHMVLYHHLHRVYK